MPRRPQRPGMGNTAFKEYNFGKKPAGPPQSMWRGGRVEQDGKAPAETTPKQALIKRRAAGKLQKKTFTGGPAVTSYKGPAMPPKGRKKKVNNND